MCSQLLVRLPYLLTRKVTFNGSRSPNGIRPRAEHRLNINPKNGAMLMPSYPDTIRMETIGERFQELTKHVRSMLTGKRLNWSAKPPAYKEFPQAERLPLPPPTAATSSVDEALHARRSVRRFVPGSLSIHELSYLLWAATGAREQRQGHLFRTSPSAGGLYPIETYVLVNQVEDLPPGLYHYDVRDHSLQRLKAGPLGREAAACALDQAMCAQAPLALVHTAVFERTVWKYGQRGYRYIYLDAAHVAANMAIAAASMGLGSCQIAAMYDDEMNSLLGVDGTRESAVYMSVVGRPAKGE